MRAVASALLAWYDAGHRDLPWRHTRDPYCIWLSEMLLQQTQVATAIPYYLRLLERYPTVAALASADLDELLSLWQGLGYYARARHLLRAAQLIVTQHGGQVPDSRKALLALPGIGDYTAGAILSIAYSQAEPAVDGNVRRVLARLYDLELDADSPAARRWFADVSASMLHTERAGDHNQAIMEFGATLCAPRNPTCSSCPLASLCLAFARGTVLERPVRAPRRAAPTHELVAAHCEQDGRLLLVRRSPAGLLGGLWELPNWAVPAEAAPAVALAAALRAHVDTPLVGEELTLVRHAYSHFAVRVHVFRCTIPAFALSNTWDALHWLARSELECYGLTGVTLKAIRQGPWLEQRLL